MLFGYLKYPNAAEKKQKYRQKADRTYNKGHGGTSMDALKQIVSQTKGIRKYFVLSFLFVGIETLFEVIIPLLMADIIDVGIGNRDPSVFWDRGMWMIVSAALALLFGVLYAKVSAKAAAMLGERIRQAEFSRMQAFTFTNIDHFETSGLITRLTSDVTVIQNAITGGIRPIARGPMMLILGMIMSFLINARLSLVFFVSGPVLALILYFIVKKCAPLYPQLQRTVDELNGIVQENLIGMRVVKAFVRRDFEEAKFEKINRECARVTQQTFHYALLNQPSFQAMMYASIVFLMFVGTNMIQAGTLEVGSLTGILSYVLQILNSFMMMSNVFLLLTRSMASVQRISQIFNEPINIHSPANGLRIQDGSVRFDNVSFKYKADGDAYVLTDISLNFPAGSVTGILGATGSAKSTLVQLIPRLYDPDKGTVYVGGIDVKDLALAPLRDDVGMVLQNNVLFSGTVEENLRWGNPDATQAEIEEACRIACVDEFIDRLPGGLRSELGQGGMNVSGGQKQRLCIARALLKKPKILIFDDSTSAVDTATDARIRKGLASIQGLTQIIIAQRISSVRHCDQIVILSEGKIADVGSHDELLARSPIYQEIFASQERGNQA